MSKPQKMNDIQRNLVEENMTLVYFIVGKNYPTYRGDEDIIHSGLLGLCRAALRWDESKGAFSTYACSCIRNAIKQELRERQQMADTVSLECPIGDDLTIADTISDNEDIYFLDDKFLIDLTETERFVFELRSKGYEIEDIQKLTGYDSRKIRKILRTIYAKYKNKT
jgi:RNA polymerase sigma factor (sigma-70 family)